MIGFTKNIRPKLYEIDYLVTMINTLDFVSATPLRRKLNFQLGKGNCLLLPLINSQTVRRVTDVNEELGKQTTPNPPFNPNPNPFNPNPIPLTPNA